MNLRVLQRRPRRAMQGIALVVFRGVAPAAYLRWRRWRDSAGRASRYRYYLGGPGLNASGRIADFAAGVTDVNGPQELWAAVQTLVNDPSDQSVLDVGCGIRPFSFRRFSVHVCLEPYHPYLEELADAHRREPSMVPIRGSAPEDLDRFPSDSFDVVVLLDVIEHLTREDGRRTLDHALRIARHRVHVFTPDGFLPQHIGPTDDEGWGFVGNQLQSHLSGWNAADFAGWRVIRCANFDTRDGQPYSALWATHSKAPEQDRLHARLVLQDAFDSSDRWESWMSALESRLFFCKATIHPELAPWSFRSRRKPRLPSELLMVDIGDADYGFDDSYALGHTCEVCGEHEPPIVVVVRRQGEIDVPGVQARGSVKTVAIMLDGAQAEPRSSRRLSAAYDDDAAVAEVLAWLDSP